MIFVIGQKAVTYQIVLSAIGTILVLYKYAMSVGVT